jgi:SAM-dependent methyltransferase
MPVQDPTQRFSSRVVDYIRYRPGYPPEVAELLKSECGLGPDSVVADIASGTGLFTHLLLEQGCQVFGVEPNAEMRHAGEQFLAPCSRFHSVAGTAEATTLAEHCVDMVTAAQAAHWFERVKTRQEFVRILKPGGWLVLLWNERRTDSTPFLREYEQLLRTYGTDYQDVRHEHTTASIDSFFAPAPFQTRVFDSRQAELRRIFDQHQKQDRVAMEYNTRVYCGKLT